MKSVFAIAGLLLILFGIVSFTYQSITYTSPEKVVEIGDLEVTADKQKTVLFPPLLSGLSLAAGIVLVVVARIKKK